MPDKIYRLIFQKDDGAEESVEFTAPQGPQGEQGPKGDKGDKGDTGETGAAGKDGAAGQNGKDGVSATHSWNGTTLTVTSASGTSSANLKGEKGDKGDKGDTGEQGPKGDQGIQGPKGDKGDTGATGAQGYGFISSVSRPSFTEAQWTTYGTIGHTENWSNTESIRNGCRIGDIFTVVGTATDTRHAHVSYYQSITASGNLRGTCIAHSIAERGATGATGADGASGSNGKDGTSVTVKSVSESTADGGSNVVTFSDGKTLTVKNGSKGSSGANGTNGKTPVKGTDYWTAADKAEMVSAVIAALPVYNGEVV
jgi:hypothetical protein